MEGDGASWLTWESEKMMKHEEKIGKQILHPHMRKKQINHFRKKMDKVLESVKVSQKKGKHN
jgi:hypothetical protein